MIAVNRTRGEILSGRLERTGTFLERARGLLGRKRLPEGCALWISPCRRVHTIGMSFPIDVIFLDESGRVLGICPNILPYRVSPYFQGAAGALEMPAGVIQRTNTAPGDLVEFREGEPQ